MNFFKKILGIDKIEKTLEDAERIKLEAENTLKSAQEEQRQSSLSAKELATEKKEPWISVLDTHIDKDNLRNGFFELDWNEYFVLQLKQAGYKGQSDEEIVDSWFCELCKNIGQETGINMERRGSGYVNRALRDDGKSEIS